MKNVGAQRGFTLIELLIVVAIIGVLSAVAIPQYQNYTARAQMTEALNLASGLKLAVTESYSSTGDWPTDNAAAGVDVKENIKGNYVSEVSISDGEITATLGGDEVASQIDGKILKLDPNDEGGSISWECRSDAEQKYLPSSCNSSAS